MRDAKQPGLEGCFIAQVVEPEEAVHQGLLNQVLTVEHRARHSVAEAMKARTDLIARRHESLAAGSHGIAEILRDDVGLVRCHELFFSWDVPSTEKDTTYLFGPGIRLPL